MKRFYVKIFTIIFLALLSISCGKNEKIERIKLKNGMRVVFQHDTSPVTSAVFLIGAGSSIGINEAADVMNKLIFEGSSIRTRQQIFQEVETLGGHIRFWTDDATSIIQVRSPSENFTRCFSIVCETISHPLFNKEHISRVLKERLNAGNKGSDVKRQIKNDVRGLLFKNSPLADSAEFSDKLITHDYLNKYYNKYYSPSNIVVAVSGDIDGNGLLKMLSSCWKSNNKEERNLFGKINTGVISAKRKIVRRISSGTARVVFAFRAPGILEKGYFAVRLLNRITAEDFNSIINDALEEQGIKFSYLHSYYFRDYGFGYFVVEVETKVRNLDKVENVITEQINKIKTDGISDSYFIIGKRKVISRIVYRGQYSNFKANVLAYLAFTGSQDLSFSSYCDKFKKLDTAQVNSVAKSLFKEPVIIKYIHK
ncbi:insulinase family protein [bacterium]|nr:insulinase family protein [bacterium]